MAGSFFPTGPGVSQGSCGETRGPAGGTGGDGARVCMRARTGGEELHEGPCGGAVVRAEDERRGYLSLSEGEVHERFGD